MNLRKTISHKLLVISLIASAAIFANPQISQAEENLWVFVTGTDTRPQGSWEIKLRDVMMKGKSSGKYVRHEISPSVEYGVTNRLTVGVTALIFKHKYELKDSNVQPMYDTQGGEGGKYNHTTLGGYRLMAKYNILSPYKDSIGVSVGVNFDQRERYRLDGANIKQNSYIFRGFFQKNWLDDKLVLAFNPVLELERRKAGQVLEEEIAIEFLAGISYRVVPKHFVGLEFRHQRDHLTPTDGGVKDPEGDQQSNFDLNDMRLGANHQYANYFGPTYHYAEKNWWYTVGALWQIAGGGKNNRGYNDDGKNWDEHERVHIGMTVGYEF